MPKSQRHTPQSCLMSTLEGFRSRWNIPAECTRFKAQSILYSNSMTSRSSRRPSLSFMINSDRRSKGKHSITRKMFSPGVSGFTSGIIMSSNHVVCILPGIFDKCLSVWISPSVSLAFTKCSGFNLICFIATKLSVLRQRAFITWPNWPLPSSLIRS